MVSRVEDVACWRANLDVAGAAALAASDLRHTPNPSSKFIDLDVEIPCARGTFAKFEPPL